ncbi:DHHC palmitoyltransferase-domain-containing protein [Cladochytrium replicatum]|nr:DHHC palmitoyltransferase-domain-containing protein [Cladochytrium replicatum]
MNSGLWMLLGLLAALAGFVFLLLFGESPQFRDGMVGKLHRFVTVTLTNGLLRILRMILGRRIVSCMGRWAGFFMNEKHPLLQIFFLTLVIGCSVIFFWKGYDKIPGPYLGSFHRVLVPLAISACLGSFALASYSDPGAVTSSNVRKALKIYDYDHVIFAEKQCSTCLIDKPARSKHCSLCKMCVARCDHHCAWINNCVGHANQRWFLLFLLSTYLLCFYGSYLVFQIFRAEIIKRKINTLSSIHSTSRQRIPISLWHQWLIMFQLESWLGAVGLFIFLAGGVVLAFTGHQLYLVLTGVTTNEVFKWEDLDIAIRNGEVREVDKRLYEYNQNYGKKDASRFVSVAERKASKGKKKEDSSSETPQMVPITSIKQFRNIYDGGWYRNLMLVIFPRSLK